MGSSDSSGCSGWVLGGCLGIGICIALAFGFAALVSDNKEDRGERSADREAVQREVEARAACIRSLEGRLKSPSSLRLIPPMDVQTDGSRWTLSGQLEAENAFGALIRSRYRCEVEEAPDEWQVIRVDLE